MGEGVSQEQQKAYSVGTERALWTGRYDSVRNSRATAASKIEVIGHHDCLPAAF